MSFIVFGIKCLNISWVLRSLRVTRPGSNGNCGVESENRDSRSPAETTNLVALSFSVKRTDVFLGFSAALQANTGLLFVGSKETHFWDASTPSASLASHVQNLNWFSSLALSVRTAFSLLTEGDTTFVWRLRYWLKSTLLKITYGLWERGNEIEIAARFEDFTTTIMKNAIFLDVPPCPPFRGKVSPPSSGVKE
jgi:hypothetical protein